MTLVGVLTLKHQNLDTETARRNTLWNSTLTGYGLPRKRHTSLVCPKQRSTNGGTSESARKLVALAVIFVIILMTALHGPVSSKMQHERL
ncbi:MAG: hypothetical protein ACR2MP_31610 [Streptosporangiaceae bacterium]